jgi:hypothetical protein
MGVNPKYKEKEMKKKIIFVLARVAIEKRFGEEVFSDQR